MRVPYGVLKELAELEPSENTTEVHLSWERDAEIDEVLSILKSWQHLHRLTLRSGYSLIPSFQVVHDFIMEMKHLTYFHITLRYSDCNCDQLEILRIQVNQSILPRRPNFVFYISRIP